MNAATALIACIPMSWLLPNHYYPWISAWQEGAALVFLFSAALVARQKLLVHPLWVWAIALAASSVAFQTAIGQILFAGDAVVVILYLGALLTAIALGSTLAPVAAGTARLDLESLAAGSVLAATLSVGVALVQWTGSVSLGTLATELPPGARPFGNVSQPNHLCTLAFWGLCSAAVLYEAGRLTRVGLWAIAAFMLLGMVLSASRTGWLQMLALILLVGTQQKRTSSRLGLTHVLAVTSAYAVATAIWPRVNSVLFLEGGRSVTHQIQGGARIDLWHQLIDAVSRTPWSGYGWQQISIAQQSVALDYPPLHRYFEHSHNFVLDLLLWAGVPLGGGILLLCLAALLRQFLNLTDGRAMWLLAAVVGVLAHAMVEFPLGYAYFLIPVGLALGMVDALTRQPGSAWTSLPSASVLGLAGLVVLAVVGMDYLRAETNHRLLRLESARIGTARVVSMPPQLLVLSQLEAFLTVARQEAGPGMSSTEIDAMKHVSERFGYAPVLFRFALAAGLNGDPQGARRALDLICSIHDVQRCREGREAWQVLQERYPVLAPITPP